MTDLTDALALTTRKTDPTSDPTPACKHEFAPHEGADRCIYCMIPWRDHVRGFGSNVAPLAPGMKRVVRA